MTNEFAIRIITGDVLGTSKETQEAITMAVKALSMPSAQTEIIKCKDCKYASPNGQYGCKAYHFKQYETHNMYADDYCSRAERRIDD